MKNIKSAILLSTLVVSGTALADLKTGLVAHYSFDDCTAKDVSGKGHDGVLNGNISCVDGVVNKGLVFDGVDSYVDINVPLAGTANWSVCAWINIAKIDSAYTDWQAIITASGNQATELGFPTASKAFSIWPDLYAKSGTAVVKKDTFMCFTGQAGKLSIFKNNVKIASGTGSTDFAALKTIGMWQPLDSDPFTKEPFNGMIDEVRAYKRILSGTELKELYYQGVPVNGVINSLGSHTITCLNATTAQSVTIPATTATAYNCEAGGLLVNPQDHITITIDGNAQ